MSKINKISKFEGIATLSSQTEKVKLAIDGLKESEALLAITNSNLSNENKKVIATKLKLISATEADALATNADTVSKYENLKVTNLLKVAWGKLSAFAKANPYLLLATAIGAATGAIYKYSKADEKALENSKEKLSEISGEYETVTSEVESLSNQVKTLNDQINELNPITDDAQIQKLKEERAEIEQEVALLKEKQALLADEEARLAEETLTKTTSSKYSADDMQNLNSTTTGDVAGDAGRALGFLISNQGFSDQVTEYEELALAMERVNNLEREREKLEKKSADAIKAGNLEEHKSIESQISDLDSEIKDVELHANTLATSIQTSYSKLKDGELKDYVGEVIIKYFEFSENIDAATASFQALNEEQQKNILINKLTESGLSDSIVANIFSNVKSEDYENLYNNMDFTPPSMRDYHGAEEYGKAYAEAWLNACKTVIEESSVSESPNEISVSSLQSYLSQDTDEIKEVRQSLLDLAKSGELTDDTFNSTKEYRNILSELGLTAEEACEQLKEIANAELDMSDWQEQLQNARKSIESLTGISTSIGSGDKSYINTIISDYPQLIQYLNDEARLQEEVNRLIEEQSVLANDAGSAMSNYSEDVYQSLIANMQAVYGEHDLLINNLAEGYRVDLNNFTTLAQAKEQIDLQLIQLLNEAWAQHYGLIVDSATGLLTVTQNMSDFYGDTGAQNQVASINEMITRLNAQKEKFENAVDFSDIGGGASSASKAGEDAGEAYIDALEDELSDMDNIIGAVGDIIQNEIDALEDAKDNAIQAIEDERDAVIGGLEDQVDALEKQKKALEDANKERQLQQDLMLAEYNLQKMLNQKTKLVKYMPDTIVI